MKYKNLRDLFDEKKPVCLINACPENTEYGKVSQEHWDYYGDIKTGSLAYFYLIGTEHAVVLINEYDAYTSETYFNKDLNAMREATHKVAEIVAADEIVSAFDVYYGEETGFCECDELFVVIPFGTDIDVANAVAKRVDELAYKFQNT